MTQIEWLRKRRDRIQVIANELAHRNIASPLPNDRYLMNVGKYVAFKSLVAWFETEIEKIQGGAEEGPQDESGIGVSEMDDDDFEPPKPRGKPLKRQPRGWGG